MERVNESLRDVACFVSFCIEQYAHWKQMTGTEVLSLFEIYGVNEYLAEFFDVLHTQGAQWILEDIDEFIEQRKTENRA